MISVIVPVYNEEKAVVDALKEVSRAMEAFAKKYFIEFNVERSHQSLGYSTPDKVYRAAVGGREAGGDQ